MAEKIIQETSLVSVADAIRAKTGLADPLTFPDGFVSAISSIAGNSGESGGDGVTIQSGSFTPAEAVSTATVELTKEATNFIVWKNTNALTYGVRTFAFGILLATMGYQILIGTNSGGSTAITYFTTNQIAIDGTTVTIKATSPTNFGSFVTEQYNWIAW